MINAGCGCVKSESLNRTAAKGNGPAGPFSQLSPISCYPDVAAVAGRPVSGYPDYTGTPWNDVTAWNPCVCPVMPAVISTRPYITRTGGDGNHFTPWWWRSNANHRLRYSRLQGQQKPKCSCQYDFLHLDYLRNCLHLLT